VSVRNDRALGAIFTLSDVTLRSKDRHLGVAGNDKLESRTLGDMNCIPNFMEIDKLVKSGRKAGLMLYLAIGPIVSYSVFFNQALDTVLVHNHCNKSTPWGHILSQLDTIPVLILHPSPLCSYLLFLMQPSHGETCFGIKARRFGRRGKKRQTRLNELSLLKYKLQSSTKIRSKAFHYDYMYTCVG
jgi:hypothetical protein